LRPSEFSTPTAEAFFLLDRPAVVLFRCNIPDFPPKMMGFGGADRQPTLGNVYTNVEAVSPTRE
jgi:hypothetical protein